MLLKTINITKKTVPSIYTAAGPCFVYTAILKFRMNKSVVEIIQRVYLFIYLGFYVTFNTVQVISQHVVERAEETSTYRLSGFCTVNCRPTASNYQLSHLRPGRELNPGLRGGRRECYHSATVAPYSAGIKFCVWRKNSK